LFDPELAARRRQRAQARPDPGAGFLMEIVAEEFSMRLQAVERHFDLGSCLFAALPSVANASIATGKIGRLSRAEIAGTPGADVEAQTFEEVPLDPDSVNLVLAPLWLHLVNDMPGSLIRIRRALRPDGLLLAAIPGSGTLAELADVLIDTETRLYGGISPRIMPFADVRAIGALLQRAGFALPVADVETYTVRYDSLFALMRDLRAFGMTNMLKDRARRPVNRRFFLEAAKLYAERHSDPDGRIRATFSVIYVSGWAPHESQQKPLKPGSAKVRLADVLSSLSGSRSDQ
jgi:SAM-dependent methyltransferase